ncbi:energy transducer TonB [Pelosinus sp. sgz500959]|uniref:energy transducer TonB n=1 Tax=Pelosinus sp. sgz500959 TaxID=3242472 RepID=UPI00366B73A5
MGLCKRTIIKKPYVKTFGISLIIHSVLLGLVVMRGYMIEPISYATPIEVEFIPTSLPNIEQTLTDLNPQTVDSTTVKNQSRSVNSEQQLQNQVLSKEDAQLRQSSVSNIQVRDTTVVQGDDGITTAPTVSAVNGNGDNHDMDKKAEGQVAKSIVGTKASHISGLRPAYPYEARRAGWEGTVVIRILVGTDGSPSAVTVRTSSGYSVLDDAAAQGVKSWRFSPARQSDKPVESYYDVRVKFDLADD